MKLLRIVRDGQVIAVPTFLQEVSFSNIFFSSGCGGTAMGKIKCPLIANGRDLFNYLSFHAQVNDFLCPWRNLEAVGKISSSKLDSCAGCGILSFDLLVKSCDELSAEIYEG